MRCALVDAWADLDLALDGVADADMIAPWGGGSAFAWTYGHVANCSDAWLNVRFRGRAPHSVIGDRDLRFGGSGRASDWAAIRRGGAAVRAQGLSLRHAITVDLTHHHYHIGEIATKRAQLGHAVPFPPGLRQRLFGPHEGG